MTSVPSIPAPARQSRGCLFYGALTCVALLLLAGMLAVLAVRFVRNTYTDVAPVTLPTVEMAEAEFQELQQRVKAFDAAMKSETPVEPLRLTGRDINAFIAKSPDARQLAGKVYVSVTNSKVTGSVSIPLSGASWLLRDRYLNGEVVFNVALDSGVLVVKAREIRVKGRPLPEFLMATLRAENLARDVSNDPKAAEAIRKFESIQVEEGVVVVKPHLPR